MELLTLATGVQTGLSWLKTGYDTYKIIGALRRGGSKEELAIQALSAELEQRFGKLDGRIEQLSEHIHAVPGLLAVQDAKNSSQQTVQDLRDMREYLDPVQRALGGELLSSALIETPQRLVDAMRKDPQSFLINVRTLAEATRPEERDLTPLLFEDAGQRYVGWQKRGFLSECYDCNYDEQWLPTANRSEPLRVHPSKKPAGQKPALPQVQNIHGWPAELVQTLQQKTAVALGRPVAFRDRLADGSEGPEMLVIPAGKFLMGSPEDEPERGDDEKQHAETLSKPFAIGRYAVTFDEYQEFCFHAGHPPPDDAGWGRGRRPVINVTWFDAMAYAEWLSAQTGKSYRLPSEAEWEYAARAGSAGPFWWGDNITTEQANYDGDYVYHEGRTGEYRAKTLEVDAFAPNPWGLHQVQGNVWEWTASEYESDYGGKKLSKNNASGRRLVIRGGSWIYGPRRLRAAGRGRNRPAKRNNDLGFRLAQD
jgi:formylglycine-generating enzyme required for sulfatase activity